MSQPLCGARTRSGEPCRRYAIAGGTKCPTHGGSSPQAKAKASQRLAEQKARRFLADLGGDVAPVSDPIAALELIGGQALALVEALRPVVAELEQIRYQALGLGGEQIRGELTAYLAALGRAESILGRIVSLGLDERRTRLQEAQVAIYVAAVGRVLDRLGLDSDQQQTARSWLASELGFSKVEEPLTIEAGSNGRDHG